MTDKILCVDDDVNVLRGYQRVLHRYQIETATGGEEALAAITHHGPFAVIVSDMRMPRMNGVEFLARVKELAPESVRMMLTGNSDQQTALEAVNDGHIFRFLTKPCPAAELAKALDAGLLQYQLIVSERELLSRTLSGAVKMLTDVLSLVSPAAFGRAARIRVLARQISAVLGEPACWRTEIAALLSQIGCVAIPESTLARHYRGEELPPAAAREFAVHPQVGRDLLKSIPRLEEVAEIIAYQEKHFDGDGPPPGGRSGTAIPLGSRILKVALDFDTLISGGGTPPMALAVLSYRTSWYDTRVLHALREVLHVTEVQAIKAVKVHELTDGMVLAEDVRSPQGALICAKGHEVSRATRLRLRNYNSNTGILEPIQVLLPLAAPVDQTLPAGNSCDEMPTDLSSITLENLL